MEGNSACRLKQVSNPKTNISQGVSNSEWVKKLGELLVNVEQAEQELSYETTDGSEAARKLTGSYYTPLDVARHFWNEHFSSRKITSSAKAHEFISGNVFVEPSAGSGILIFSLIEKLACLGVGPKSVAQININVVDINAGALNFIYSKLNELEDFSGCKFESVKYINSDFLKLKLPSTDLPIMVFGNPPFVKNDQLISVWSNSFADFLEASIEIAGVDGAVQLILPLSINFGRNYSALRENIRRRQYEVRISSFDNIPDTLFKSGKPMHTNSNKANSQRCSIICLLPSDSYSLSVSPLHRWSRKERTEFLNRSVGYFEGTTYSLDDQFPRIQSDRIVRYLKAAECASERVSDWISQSGEHSLFISNVARNFIGIRDGKSGSSHELKFETRSRFLAAFLIFSSDLYFDYWLTVGDGFHVTKANLMGFPVAKSLSDRLEAGQPIAEYYWRAKEKFAKTKKNAGKSVKSFDFSGEMPTLYE